MLRVFRDHAVAAEFPDHYGHTDSEALFGRGGFDTLPGLEGMQEGELVIFDGPISKRAKVVARFKPGEWHGAGPSVSMHCAGPAEGAVECGICHAGRQRPKKEK